MRTFRRERERERETGHKSGPEARGWQRKGDESERRRELDYRVRVGFATAEPQKTGRLRRNQLRVCRERGNESRSWQAHHERAMSGQSVDVVWDPQTQTNSLEGWDYSIELAYLKSLKGSSSESNLQLAAELGKTLLERNKELENIIKLHQATVEEQSQEIEYMKKQTAALREVNNTRLKVYEQLEVSVQDLERANHHLVIENTSDKKLIKSQSVTIENLEIRCEELQKKIDDLAGQLRQRTASPSRNNNAQQQQQQETTDWETSDTQGGSEKQRAAPSSPKSSQETVNATAANDAEMTELLRQLQDARSQRAREQKKVSELSQQLTTLLQENSALEEQLTELRNKAHDVKSLQDEINTLEEVRRGQLCGRCLRGMDTRTHDELSIMLDQEEYDDISVAESLISENQRDSEQTVQDTASKNECTDELESANPYRVLVEKYQALLEVQRHCQPRRKDAPNPATCMSLQEELEMSGEFNNFYPTEGAVAAGPESNKVAASRAKVSENSGKKPFSATPTDFSEAETSSSGFSDETSNKATQTDGRPGSFLCSIADGEDCKFSIYDDNSTFESRFRKTPEYRQLFSEIFGVLKRAAEAKDEGEKLPLLDDSTTSQATCETFQEDLQSEATDDNQSVMSSMVSSVVSEPVFSRVLSTNSPPSNGQQSNSKSGNIGAKQPDGKDAGCRMDYVSVNLRMRKKPSAKKNTVKRALFNGSATPDIIPTTNPKFVPPKPNGGGRRRFKPFNPAEHEHPGTWNGQNNAYSTTTRSRDNNRRQQHTCARGSGEQQQHNNYEYRDFKPSTASEEVARLKRLEMSYAEVLRTPNNKSRTNNNNHHHHHHHHRKS